MSSELARIDVPARGRYGSRNTMTFPRELREAIPDLPTYVGRVLDLDSMHGEAVDTFPLAGKRVAVVFVVKETGKLEGEFKVRVDLQPEAARALGQTLIQLADKAEQVPEK
ncbi:MAG TPA: hypothetical protein VGF59_35010 [Bryobacteraceae bacterium]